MQLRHVKRQIYGNIKNVNFNVIVTVSELVFTFITTFED